MISNIRSYTRVGKHDETILSSSRANTIVAITIISHERFRCSKFLFLVVINQRKAHQNITNVHLIDILCWRIGDSAISATTALSTSSAPAVLWREHSD